MAQWHRWTPCSYMPVLSYLFTAYWLSFWNTISLVPRPVWKAQKGAWYPLFPHVLNNSWNYAYTCVKWRPMACGYEQLLYCMTKGMSDALLELCQDLSHQAWLSLKQLKKVARSAFPSSPMTLVQVLPLDEDQAYTHLAWALTVSMFHRCTLLFKRSSPTMPPLCFSSITIPIAVYA